MGLTRSRIILCLFSVSVLNVGCGDGPKRSSDAAGNRTDAGDGGGGTGGGGLAASGGATGTDASVGSGGVIGSGGVVGTDGAIDAGGTTGTGEVGTGGRSGGADGSVDMGPDAYPDQDASMDRGDTAELEATKDAPAGTDTSGKADCDTTVALPFLHTEGTHTVDECGNRVVLRGLNLGSWLLVEPWLVCPNATEPWASCPSLPDQDAWDALLANAAVDGGTGTKDNLLDLFRSNWIADRDFRFIASIRSFNVVRVPFDHSLLEDPALPQVLRQNAFKWLDEAVRMARANGLYVILDLHGAPGGQSNDQSTGHLKTPAEYDADSDNLWKSTARQDETVWLWSQIVEHFKNEPTVAAFELMNEPFVAPSPDACGTNPSDPLVALMGRLYDTIRVIDEKHIIVIPAAQDGIGRYGDPSAHGWRNVMFTEHHYPGIYEGPAGTMAAHENIAFDRLFPWLESHLGQVKTPFLYGEFNVVNETMGGATLMRQYYDTFAGKGWWATMWSYKGILAAGDAPSFRSGWTMVVNKNAPPLRSYDGAGYDALAEYFRWLGSMEYATGDLVAKLNASDPLRFDPERETPYRTTVPDGGTPAATVGWQANDIGCAQPPGGENAWSASAIDVYGGGSDIFGSADSFRFVSQHQTGDFELAATVERLDGIDAYSKAGIMIRAGQEANAPHVFLHVFPNNQVVLAHRDVAGGKTWQEEGPAPPALAPPVQLKLQRAGNTITAEYAMEGRDPLTFGPLTADWLVGSCDAGLAVLSHDEHYLAEGLFRQISIGSRGPQSSPAPLPCSLPHAQPDLQNASFATVDSTDSNWVASWRRWGSNLKRHGDWQPHWDEPNAMVAYEHWLVTDSSANSEGMWQDIAVESGRTYTFSIYAMADPVTDPKHPAENVELRLETTWEGTQLTVASETYNYSMLAQKPSSGDKPNWSQLIVRATAPTTNLRVLVIVQPASTSPRDGSIKFDQAELHIGVCPQ